jgi:hypothetical protein
MRAITIGISNLRITTLEPPGTGWNHPGTTMIRTAFNTPLISKRGGSPRRSLGNTGPPILHRAKRVCFCEMLAAAMTYPRRASLVRVPFLADYDPKARSALRI